MKKSFFLTAMIAAVIFLVSGCYSSEDTTKKNENIPQLYFAGQDTVISSQQFILSPFTKEYCGKIVNGQYWNPTGFKNDSFKMQGNHVPQDSLKKWFGGNMNPYEQVNKANNASFNGAPQWLQDLFWILLALLILVIGAAIILWALRSGEKPKFTTKSVADVVVPDSTKKESFVSHSAKTGHFGKEDYEGVVLMIEALKKGQNGGRVKFIDAIEIEIPSGPELSIRADRGSIIAGVDVHVHSGGNAYGAGGSAHNHGVNDHREFHRQSGDQKEKSSDKDKKEEKQ